MVIGGPFGLKMPFDAAVEVAEESENGLLPASIAMMRLGLDDKAGVYQQMAADWLWRHCHVIVTNKFDVAI